MSLSSFLTDLGAARTRFVGLLSDKGITVANDATIHQCLDLLAAYLDSGTGDTTGGDMGGGTVPPVGERPSTTMLTLIAPDDLSLYAGTADYASHAWDDADVLTVRVLNGATVLTTLCTSYNGMEFEYNTITHLCAGNRVMVDVGSKPSGIDSAELTIQWLRGAAVVKTETRTFDWMHTPDYFLRPTGEGNYNLKINGTTANAEVFYNGEWIDFPGGVLSSAYAGCPVRTRNATALDAIACWSCDDIDGDNFWYLT